MSNRVRPTDPRFRWKYLRLPIRFPLVGTPRRGAVEPHLNPGTAARLAAAWAGKDLTVRLRLGDLQVGQVGVLEAEVRAVAPVRSYQRKRGGDGLLVRVTLADRSGEADLVLWDDEVRLTKDGPL